MILGFSNILRNSTPFYYVDLPSFQRDFAALKTLDHGTGPNITFTRASDATYFDANGVLQTASNNVPRFDHDAATGSSLGLLIEEARTNSIRNAQAGGAVAGSSGTAPTNWAITGTANGVTREIVAVNTEDGLSYIDVKYSGTPTSNGSANVVFESNTHVAASSGQTWTASAYIRLAGGALTNATVRKQVSGRLVTSGSVVAGQEGITIIAPDSAALRTQRRSATFTFTSSDVASVVSFVNVTYTSGQPIDLTLRIAAPQLEQGAFPTSYIPTTTAAATRSADSAVVTPISGFYNQSEGTLFAEFTVNSLAASGQFPRVVDIGSTGNSFRIETYASGASLGIGSYVTTASSNAYGVFGNASGLGLVTKAATAIKTDDFRTAVNGSLFGSADSSGALPSAENMTTLGIGRQAVGVSTSANQYIRKLAYWPRRLSNTLLQQLTT